MGVYGDNSTFIGWIDNWIYRHVYDGMDGGYPGELVIHDEVVICHHNGGQVSGKCGSLEIYNKKKLEELYELYDGYYRDGKTPNFGEVVKREREKWNDPDMNWATLSEEEPTDDDFYEGYVLDKIDNEFYDAQISFDDVTIRLKGATNEDSNK